MDADDNRQTNDWKRAFERRSAADFADAFAEDVVLDYKNGNHLTPVSRRRNIAGIIFF